MSSIQEKVIWLFKSVIDILASISLRLLKYLRQKRVFQVFRSFLMPLFMIFLSLLFINQTVFYIQSKSSFELIISEPSLAMIMTASIALTSLYLAWLEFILRRKPFVMPKWDIKHKDKESEELCLKLINMGDSPVGLTAFNYSFAKREGEQIYFDNKKYESFEEDKLEPHEEIECELGESIYLAEANDLTVLRPDGREIKLGSVRKFLFSNVYSLSDEFRDFEREIREIYRKITKADYRIGRTISLDEFKEKDVEELTKEIEQNSKNIWSRLNFSYQRKVYGVAVAGARNRDPITRILYKLSIRRNKKAKK